MCIDRILLSVGVSQACACNSVFNYLQPQSILCGFHSKLYDYKDSCYSN